VSDLSLPTKSEAKKFHKRHIKSGRAFRQNRFRIGLAAQSQLQISLCGRRWILGTFPVLIGARVAAYIVDELSAILAALPT
jgi:hypothetical protein